MSNPEKPPIPPSELGEYGDLPPPPPGPPPPQQQQQQQQQQDPHLPQQSHQQPPHDQQTQQQHFPPPPSFPPPPMQQEQQQHDPDSKAPDSKADYSIPAYNPADPVFAPPPTADKVQYHQDQPPVAHEQPVAEASQKKSGWSSRFSQLGAKVAAPINSVAHKLGSQSFLPETLDKECDKAAAILKAFCKKGVYADPNSAQVPTSTDPKAAESTDGIIDPTKEKPKARVVVTIPPKVISKALGLAIFTTFRAGFHFSGATGSGVLIARLPDGSWSPPSGIQVHSVGAGLQIGLDIYDCVCVINSKDALAAFMNTRVSLGSDLAVVAGPYGAGGAVDLGATVDRSKAGKKEEGTAAAPPAEKPQGEDSMLQPGKTDQKGQRRSLSASGFKPVFSYVKSRGFYAGIQVDGTVVVERKDANSAFYGTPIAVDQILKGHVPPQGPAGMWPSGARTLTEVLAGAEAGVLPDKDVGTAAAASAPVPPPAAAESSAAAAPPPSKGVTTGAAAQDDEALPAYSDPTGEGAQYGSDPKWA